ncbi:Gfo/Idh/MocA family oxidoreductase [Kineosporia sp. J2-2]|uniref:Gfo/Idh/MocA family oxidoreductase n=1 Tax=Kineosporia corallincola TaxID=2835133 RepID=A0ABS5TRM6_9ACTN|nr:Gfo/Idh/MocA family oxidoreductase [Kineosporia corallincola]MBT0773447.1 Gfo/Idh/MocA family oxidoreductase [Kineosporia corallincola]
MPPVVPAPHIPDPAAVPALRWGVVGTGIAGRFVHAIHRHTPQRAVAVTARNPEKTAAFAAEHGVERVLATPSELVSDQGVDVVYIATPHPLHRDLALEAIAAGKHVLIEKPIGMSAQEAREITDAGRAAGVLVMEAMWTRYLPQSDIVRQILASGVIGEVHRVTADFGFNNPYDPSSRLWDPAQGGGALLDAGVYPISFASSVLGEPQTLKVAGLTGPGGVDVRADILATYAGGVSALLSTALDTSLPTQAGISGTEGHIEIGPGFLFPSGVTLTVAQESASWRDERFEAVHEGLSDQATYFAGYVAEGRVESPLHPHSEVVSILATIDEARRQLA